MFCLVNFKKDYDENQPDENQDQDENQEDTSRLSASPRNSLNSLSLP